jgi:predicted esterase
MKQILFATLIILAGAAACPGQWVVDTRTDIPKASEQEVGFLEETPVIDGFLDAPLRSLPVRQFAVISRYQADPVIPITYRIAYGTEFLYVYIEAAADHLTYRDRAFQNGDGFLLLLGKPQPKNEPTDEFYELACGAVDSAERIWQKRIFWNYNVDKVFVPTSLETKMESRAGNGTISFVLLLPWTDVRPYHPWLSEGIGFNLTFVKAVEPKGIVYYQVVDDDSGREFKKRSYIPLAFQKPAVNRGPQTFVAIKEGHIREGDSLHGVAVTAAAKPGQENLNVYLGTAEGFAEKQLITYDCLPGITRKEFSLPTQSWPEGGYLMRWNSQNKDSLGTTGLSIIPRFDETEANERLKINSRFLAKGTVSTLQFMVSEMQYKIAALKTYERSVEARMAMIFLTRMLNLADRGIDPFAVQRGFIRKAFRSRIDNSLQPYTVYLPENYDQQKKYPLLVYLHGSASDETDIMGSSWLIPKGFIAVAPFGRGKSNGFTMDHAQEDIAEAIAAVGEDYAVDNSRILLTGFSMGGYGAYRTFFEAPRKYKAVAIFSGTPTLRIKDAPDFSEEKNLAPFAEIPVFIFHGEKDMNCAFAITRDVAAKLIKAGASVELQIDPDKGHEMPTNSTIDVFMKWVEKVME